MLSLYERRRRSSAEWSLAKLEILTFASASGVQSASIKFDEFGFRLHIRRSCELPLVKIFPRR
jgi:hypothetical protein